MKTKAPSNYSKSHRGSVIALARLEKEAFLHLRNTVRLAESSLIGRVQGQSESGIYRAIQKAAASLQNDLEDDILDVRAEARRSSHESLLKEIESLRDDVDEDVVDPEIDHWTDKDVAHAHATASSFRAAWMAAVMAAVNRSISSESDISSAISEASRQQDYRLARIARTESASAFSDARNDATDDLAEEHKDRDWAPLVFKRWDATLDSKVCNICRDMDGTYVPIGIDFSEPIPNHANCRCVTTLVYLPVPLPASEKTGT